MHPLDRGKTVQFGRFLEQLCSGLSEVFSVDPLAPAIIVECQALDCRPRSAVTFDWSSANSSPMRPTHGEANGKGEESRRPKTRKPDDNAYTTLMLVQLRPSGSCSWGNNPEGVAPVVLCRSAPFKKGPTLDRGQGIATDAARVYFNCAAVAGFDLCSCSAHSDLTR